MSDWRIEEDHKAAVENPGDECGDRVLPYTGLRVIVRWQEAKRRFSGRSGGFAWRKGKLGKLTLLGGVGQPALPWVAPRGRCCDWGGSQTMAKESPLEPGAGLMVTLATV